MTFNFKFTQKLVFCFALLMCALGMNKALASHFAAADMYVTYIGTGPTDLKYKVVLDVYKACEPNNSDLYYPETISYSSAKLGVNVTGIIIDTIGTGHRSDTLDQLCANFAPINSCRVPGSQWPGFVMSEYTTIITLPGTTDDWEIIWTEGARNQGIANICQPSSQNITIRVGLNNEFRYNNSSPRFTVKPIPYLCQNQQASFFNGPVDPNGDSLRIENKQPEGCTGGGCACGANTEIPYVGTYSLTNPIASSTTYNVSPTSGVATFIPTLQGKFVLAFRCYEYDRTTGTRLGYITRDVQVSVLACNSPAPVIDSIPSNVQGGKFTSTSGNVILGCPGTTFSFDMQAHSQSATNTVTLYGDTAATPGATFTVTNNGTGNPIGHFAWNPTNNDIGDHIFVIQAVDSTCTNQQPIVFRSYMVVLIKVITGVDAGPDKFGYCALNNKPVQLEASAGISGLSYVWTDVNGGPAVGLNNPNIYNPQAIVHVTTSYRVAVVNNQLPANCKLMDTVTVHIDSSNKVTITPATPVILCRPDYLPLSASTSGPAPLRNLACGTLDTISCASPDSADVVPDGVAPSANQNNYNSTPFYGYYNTSKHQYLLRKTDLLGSGIHSSTLKSIAFKLKPGYSGPATINNLKIALKCTGASSLSATTGQLSGTTPVYTATGPVTVVAAPNGYVKFDFDTPYSWDTTQNLIVEVCYANSSTYSPIYTYYISTAYTSTLNQYYYSGNICGTSPTFYGPYAYTEMPQMRFNYCNADTVPFTYTWSAGTYLSDSTISNPVAYIPKSTKYYVTTAGRSGCKVIDSVDIYVPIHNVVTWPKDTAVCAGESVILHARNSYSYHWYEDQYFNPATSLSCDNCEDPLATPPADRDYYLVTSDSVNCRDTFKLHVTVKPLPNVNILNGDTMIKYGQSVQLLASGAYLYYWSPTATLNNPNLINPTASPTEPTVYYLTGIATNGCRAIDSVKISIDYRDHLMIPSAFTPNADGRNDEFKIVNLTFQKVMEFRVFNRWGQEIFSTTDGKKGWDGTWKGVVQEMGTYNYIIRVGYPDGYVETYKGDVTLVR